MKVLFTLFNNISAGGKAVNSLQKALNIAGRNPKTHTVLYDLAGHRGVTDIIRHTGDSVRIASYHKGKLFNISRLYGKNAEEALFNALNSDSKVPVVFSNLKGVFDIGRTNFISASETYTTNIFKDFKSLLKYFREELPVLKSHQQ